MVSICLSKVINPGYMNVNSEVMFYVEKEREKGKKKLTGWLLPMKWYFWVQKGQNYGEFQLYYNVAYKKKHNVT